MSKIQKLAAIKRNSKNKTYTIVIPDDDKKSEYVVLDNIAELSHAVTAQRAAENAFRIGKHMIAKMF